MSEKKIVINLPTPTPASDDCLPHAAMTLGSIRGVGTRPMATLVSRVVIQEHMGQWCMYRLDDGGGFVGDTWHPTRADAVSSAEREFGSQISDAVALQT
jgi:hypothetical protein